MLRKQFLIAGLVTLLLTVFIVAIAATTEAQTTTNLVETVRQATVRFKDLKAAEEAGYALDMGCVSGQQEGAMGVHYFNGDFIADTELDPTKPELLLYEFQNGTPRLLGVEYLVDAAAWDAENEMPPVLMGQVFNYTGSPNRYKSPAFYELHVWAWKNNPGGMFADWNPNVSCDDYMADH